MANPLEGINRMSGGTSNRSLAENEARCVPATYSNSRVLLRARAGIQFDPVTRGRI